MAQQRSQPGDDSSIEPNLRSRLRSQIPASQRRGAKGQDIREQLLGVFDAEKARSNITGTSA